MYVQVISVCAGEPDPPKKGRTGFHGNKECGDCSVWLQVGGEDRYKLHHVHANERLCHPGTDAPSFSRYLSAGDVTVTPPQSQLEQRFTDTVTANIQTNAHLVCIIDTGMNRHHTHDRTLLCLCNSFHPRNRPGTETSAV